MCSEKLVDLVFILATKVLSTIVADHTSRPQLDRNVDDMRSQLGETTTTTITTTITIPSWTGTWTT